MERGEYFATPPIRHWRDLQRGFVACDVVWARSSVCEVVQESNVEYISRYDIIVYLQRGCVGRYLLPAVSAEFCQFVSFWLLEVFCLLVC